MTPQPSLPPAFPVAMLPGFPPLPRSSSPACMTILRPSIDNGPSREITESEISTIEVLVASATMFPKSPTCLQGNNGTVIWFHEHQNQTTLLLGRA